MPRVFLNKDIPSWRPVECNFCGKILSRKSTLLDHIEDFHKSTKKITCTIGNCNYKTNRVGNYNLHLEKVHKMKLPVIKCYSPGCGKRSKRENSIIEHMRKCSQKPVFETIKCRQENCREEFLTEKGLKIHLLVKHNYSEEDKEDKEERFLIEKFYEDIEELLSY